MNYAIGIDLGGTNIKAVTVTESGVIQDLLNCDTEDNADAAWAEKIRQLIRELEDRRGAVATWTGLAAPGLAAPDGRSIAFVSGWLQGLIGFNWTNFLARPVSVLNDAHAALLGEAWKGAAVGYRHAVLLTLGTGVGGAILSDGRLMKGHIGRAGHLGHMCLDIDGTPDALRIPGSLENAIGNFTLAARSQGRFTTTRQLVEAHLAGDAEASDIWLRSVYQLACGITSIINIIDPEVIIIGGGIAQAGSGLFAPLDQYLERLECRPQGHRVGILPASLGDIAGALGAAYNAMRAPNIKQV